MLIGGVIDHQLGDHLQPALVRLAQEGLEVAQRAVARIDLFVVRDVVAVILQGRRIEGQQPDARDAQPLDVVQFRRQAGEVADAIGVAVEEGADVDLIDQGVLYQSGSLALPGRRVIGIDSRRSAVAAGRGRETSRSARP